MASAAPFIVVSLPRSRSAWMAHFLAFGGRYAVGHDTLVECNSIAQFISGFRLMAGTCETGAVLGWRIIRQVMPEVKLVTVRRPVHEVAASFARFGIPVDEKELEARAAMLDALAQQPGVLALEYDTLSHHEICQQLFSFCLGEELPDDWYSLLVQTNIQIDMNARMQQLIRRQPQIAALKAEVLARSGGLVCHSLN